MLAIVHAQPLTRAQETRSTQIEDGEIANLECTSMDGSITASIGHQLSDYLRYALWRAKSKSSRKFDFESSVSGRVMGRDRQGKRW
jgi:hypothetical protein